MTIMCSRTSINILLFMFIVLVNSASCVVVDWGEVCEHADECGDHRLICKEVTVNNETSKICVCDRYHEWNGTLVGCVQKYSAAHILGTIKDQNTEADRIEREANLIFTAQITAGLMVLAIGFTCACSVTIFCYRMWHQDTRLEDIVKRMESQKQSTNKPTTSRALR